ncbi:hypothetical protein JI739_01810 [Ramlibacter sp. AW1]|uniref:Uncharacterized protein n=1 Tax=Ramlibacter aurantiacus TaxID=2801330 RepID=A0A936ZFR6_9BURK|nr:hypothetical protein [Ramlibacter aurantiacus]MBL0419072.1 hypothetical protein [Ramlibacter aurantiacus]
MPKLKKTHCSPRWTQVLRRSLLGAAAGLLLGASQGALAQSTICPTNISEQQGILADGTPYGMRFPANWNGLLINDLDYFGARASARTCYWLNRGYAVSGTNRHPLRSFQYDPAQEIRNLLQVVDLFSGTYGNPSRIVQYGHSGGGFVALGMSETQAHRIDGVVAGCAHEQVPLMNQMLDGWFVLQKLIAPELQITHFTDLAAVPALAVQWRAALTAAQATPIGRARIALAATIGQWPAWSSPAYAPPSPQDLEALQQAMFDTAILNAGQPGGQSRFMSEHAGGVPPASPRQLSWNTGVDYAKLFLQGENAYTRSVRELYRRAQADVADDLAVLDTSSRVQADPSAIAFWSEPGRTVHGTPQVPVLRFHTTGDNIVPPQIIDSYEQKMRAQQTHPRLYARTLVQAPGHCTFGAAESAAAMETLLQRIETGKWPSTRPADMNALATSLIPGSQPRFVEFRPVTYSRPDNAPPATR